MMGPLKMMSCHEAMARLWEFLDGELPEDERHMLERHLEVCSRCFPAYDFQRAYLEYTRRLATRESTPERLRRELFRRILETEGAGGGP
jgi:anti-sigma factor (TIGR02949 family)